MRSSGWGGGSLTVSPDGRNATITGRGALRLIQSDRPGRNITVDYRVDLIDGRDSASPDAFAISILQGGAAFHQVGTTAVPITLGGGQVKIFLR
jgi:hypothetical protein